MNFIEALRKTTESIKNWVENRKTSWNDLTDKPFGEETVWTVIIPEQTAEQSIQITENVIPLIEGQAYTIYFDGVKYERTAQLYKHENGFDMIYIGDIAALDGQAGEEPFLVYYMQMHSQVGLVAMFIDGGTHTFRLEGDVTMVTPISLEFIPKQPILEFTYRTMTSCYCNMTFDEAEVLSKHWLEGGSVPQCIYRLNNDIEIASKVSRPYDETVKEINITFPSFTITFTPTDITLTN